MLLEKYRPKSPGGIVGNSRGAQEILSFARNWKGGFAVVSGPPGCGKSLALELAAKELECDFIEGSIDEVKKSSQEVSLLGKGKILAVDIDEMEGTGYRQYLQELESLAKNARWPLFFITNDIYQDSLWRFRKKFYNSKTIRFFPPFESYVVNFLENICKSEDIRYEREALAMIARISEGDVRFALLALESMPVAAVYYAGTLCRDGLHNVYTALDYVFEGKGIPEGQDAWNILHIIAENIPGVYGAGSISYAYRCVALAEWLSRKTRKSEDVLAALPRMPKQRRKYAFPKRSRERFPADVAQKLHCSSKKAAAYGHVLKKLGVL